MMRLQIAILLVVFIATGHAFAAEPTPPDGSCADAIIAGRVVEQSYTEVSNPPGLIIMDVFWTLRVKVHRVIRGVVPSRLITVTAVAHTRLRQDRDIVFYLRHVGDNSYRADLTKCGSKPGWN